MPHKGFSFPDNRGVLDLLERPRAPPAAEEGGGGPDAYSTAASGASYCSYSSSSTAANAGGGGAGIFPLLDDRCRSATHPSDAAFASDLYRTCQSHPRFRADASQRMSMLFSVVHHCGGGSSVEYDVEGFVEGNRDELRSELTGLLASSTNAFVRFLAKMIVGPPGGRGGGGESGGSAGTSLAASSSSASPQAAQQDHRRPTVAGRLSARLCDLRRRIERTECRMVRCLRPNGRLAPESFDPAFVRRQLRRAGVVEAARFSRAAEEAASRRGGTYWHGEFVRRYWMLVDGGADLFASLGVVVGPSGAAGRDRRSAEVVVKAVSGMLRRNGTDNPSLNSDPPIQIGRTKVFLSSPALDGLEYLRDRNLLDRSVVLQAFLRSAQARRTLRAARLIACWGQFRWRRGQRAGKAQRRNSALAIQRAARRMLTNRQMRAATREQTRERMEADATTAMAVSIARQQAQQAQGTSSSTSWQPKEREQRAPRGRKKRHSISDGTDVRTATRENNKHSSQQGQTKGQLSARQHRRLSSSCPPNEMAETIRRMEEERAVMKEQLAAATAAAASRRSSLSSGRHSSVVTPPPSSDVAERNRRLEEENSSLRQQVETLRERAMARQSSHNTMKQLQSRVRSLEEERDRLKEDLAGAREEVLNESRKQSEEIQKKISIYEELNEARNHAKELARQLALTQKVASKEIKRLRKENSDLMKVQDGKEKESKADPGGRPQVGAATPSQAPAAPSAQRPARRRASSSSTDMELQRLQAEAERQRMQSEALKRRLAEEERKAGEAKEDMNMEMRAHRAHASQLRSRMAGESSKATGEHTSNSQHSRVVLEQTSNSQHSRVALEQTSNSQHSRVALEQTSNSQHSRGSTVASSTAKTGSQPKRSSWLRFSRGTQY